MMLMKSSRLTMTLKTEKETAMSKTHEKTCCICGRKFTGWGNNPYPMKDQGECCDSCNQRYVIPARLALLKLEKNSFLKMAECRQI